MNVIPSAMPTAGEAIAITINPNNANPFDQIKQIDEDGFEYWLATEMLTLLGYQTWRRIKDTVERAKISLKNIGLEESHHFVNVVQMARIGTSQAFREVVKDFKLSRYACYVTAMNGDPRKPEIAAAQNYFAYKTSEAELAIVNQQAFIKLVEKVQRQDQLIEEYGKAIAQLQSQLQKLLPPSADFTPPGWNPEIWKSLPPQDKQHFRFLYHQHGFIPSDQGIEPLEIPVFTSE